MKTLLIFTLLKVLIFTAGNVILEYRLLSYHNENNQTVDSNNITNCCNPTEPLSQCISPCKPSVEITISGRNSTQYNEDIKNLPRMTAFNFTNLFRSAFVVNLSNWNFKRSRINVLVYNENRSSVIIKDLTAKHSVPENAERKVSDHIVTMVNQQISAKFKLAWMLYSDQGWTPIIVDLKDEICCENGFLNCIDSWNGKNCSSYCQVSTKRKCHIKTSEIDGSDQKRLCEATTHGSCSKEEELSCSDIFYGPDCSILCKNNTYGYCTNSGLICNNFRFGYDCSVFCKDEFCVFNNKAKLMNKFVTVFVEINRTTSFTDVVMSHCMLSLVRNNREVLVTGPCETKQLGVHLDDWKVSSDEIQLQLTIHPTFSVSIQLVGNNTEPGANMYSSKAHRSIYNSTFFDDTLIYFKTWIYYTNVSNNVPSSSSSFSTKTISTQTKYMSFLSTNTDKSISKPHFTTKLLSDKAIITNAVQLTMGIDNKDEFISKDFPSTLSKDSRITKSLSADLSTTEVQMSTQLVQTSFDYTPSLHYETGGHISSTAWSSNNHLLLHSDILSNDVTYKCVSPKCTPSKQLNHDSTFNQEKISSTFIFDHGIIDVFTSSINSFSASPKLAFTTSASSFVINNRYYSKLSMFNNSQHSKHSLGSVLLQSSSTYPVSSASSSIMNDYEASKFSMTTISSHSKQYHSSVIVHSSAYELKTSVQTISPSSQKISTNHVNRISTLIVPVSSPHQTTVYSSSLKTTKAATLPPKMVITTSFIVLPRRTTSTVSPMISTSNIDPTTGLRNEPTLKNWMKDNMLLVLGISIGVAVVLVVVVIILIVRRKKSNKPPPRPELDPSDLFSNRRVTLLLGPDDELMPDLQPEVTHSNPLYSSVFVEPKHSNYTGNRDSHFC